MFRKMWTLAITFTIAGLALFGAMIAPVQAHGYGVGFRGGFGYGGSFGYGYGGGYSSFALPYTPVYTFPLAVPVAPAVTYAAPVALPAVAVTAPYAALESRCATLEAQAAVLPAVATYGAMSAGYGGGYGVGRSVFRSGFYGAGFNRGFVGVGGGAVNVNVLNRGGLFGGRTVVRQRTVIRSR